MRKTRISLANFLLICLILMLTLVYIHQRQQIAHLENTIGAFTAPIEKEISSLNLSVAKRQLQIEYAKQVAKRQLEPFQVDQSPGIKLTDYPVGMRRQLANIRNSQLKLEREKSRVEALERQLKQMLEFD